MCPCRLDAIGLLRGSTRRGALLVSRRVDPEGRVMSQSYLAPLTAALKTAGDLAHQKIGTGPARVPEITKDELEAFENEALQAISEVSYAVREARRWPTVESVAAGN